jgi:vitamin B12/bleomycin/antimicrobial peptide transport system ATP-binding/permease protein
MDEREQHKAGSSRLKNLRESFQFLQKVWRLTKSYWQSEEKGHAFFLLGAIVALTLGVVFMLLQINEWYNTFYSALQNYESEKIFYELLHFCGLAFLYIILAVYAFYLRQVLAIRWRRWLTNAYIDRWMSDKTYYLLQMFGTATDNPDQRISEDVRLFVEYTLQFGIGILKALATFLAFVFVLWRLSGPLSFSVAGWTVHIPGYMVWTALLYAGVGTWLTYKVGHRLVGLNFVQQRLEADFRFSMMRMRENCESVAFYGGEQTEESVFKKRFGLLLDNFWAIIKKQKDLTWLASGYGQIAIIFPLVVAMPRYLAKEITLGGLMQISSAFGRVQESLSYIVDMYSSIAEWQAVVDRLTSFGEHMASVRTTHGQDQLERVFLVSGDVTARGLEIDLPNGNVLIRPVDFTLPAGRNVLIQGVSGSGKSTLLRVLAGIWPYTKGFLSMPGKEFVLFIPQRPYLPLGTLRDAILYPGTKNLDDEALRPYMERCHIAYLWDKLHEEGDWSHILSIGEQQRLAFTRALIYEPQWLFLDEASSALDEATEAAVYAALVRECPHTTFVSVGHRSTLVKFHQDVLYLEKDTQTLRRLAAVPQ